MKIQKKFTYGDKIERILMVKIITEYSALEHSSLKVAYSAFIFIIINIIYGNYF